MIEKLKKYVILLPISFVLFWAFFALFHENFFVGKDGDFQYFYNASVRLLQNPSTLYADPLFLNLPAFAYSFVVFAIIPYWEGHFLLWGINIILGVLFVLELNKIFRLIGLEKEITRAFFLLIVVVNWTIYVNFYYPQIKIIVATIVAFVVRRQFEYKNKGKSFGP